MYKYKAFGLKIHSQLEFPEFVTDGFEAADLTIALGKTPDKLNGPNVSLQLRSAISPTEYLLQVDGIARYYARNGEEIIVQPDESIDVGSLRVFLLTSVMAAVMYQRNLIPLHASGVIINGELVLFAGSSGIGKSTTAQLLMNEGYQFFSDDICTLFINQETQEVEAIPSYALLKLWEDTSQMIVPSGSKEGYKLRPELSKLGFIQNSTYLEVHYPVKRIFFLRNDPLLKKFTCTRLENKEAFKAIEKNIYRRRLVNFTSKKQLFFEIGTRLTRQVECLEISRPYTTSIQEFLEYLKEQIVND